MATKAARKIHTKSVAKEEKSSGWDLCLWEGTQKGREITWVKILLGSDEFELYMVTLALKSNTRKTSTLGWFDSQRNWQKSCGKPRLNSGGMYTCLLTPKRGQRGQVETVWDAS